MSTYHGLSVPKKQAQRTRKLLAKKGHLNELIKIHPDPEGDAHDRLLIATTIEVDDCQMHNDVSLQEITTALRARDLDFRVSSIDDRPKMVAENVNQNPLSRAVRDTIMSSPGNAYVAMMTKEDWRSLEQRKIAYNIFTPMLLINAASLQLGGPKHLLEDLFAESPFADLFAETFWQGLSDRMNVTHIALNAPIAAKLKATVDSPEGTENVLRSPDRLQPVYGDFGPPLPAFPEHVPSQADFDAALWVECRQNGITQTWAPRYTMFSQGNVTEKARLLELQSMKDAVAEGQQNGRGTCAVDLFAGIGYFAFSYVKVGIDKVVCFDLNPWSVEGLRRGANANKWGCVVLSGPGSGGGDVDSDFVQEVDNDSTRLVAFAESNIGALQRWHQLQSQSKRRLPPIRHVNAGMLPSAAMAWKTAVALIDEKRGGWVHLHESVFENRLNNRANEILADVEKTWMNLGAIGQVSKSEQAVRPQLEHIEKVKSMGPRLIHVVLDVWIPPRS